MTPQPSTPKGWNLDVTLYVAWAGLAALQGCIGMGELPKTWAVPVTVATAMVGAWKMKRSGGKNDPAPVLPDATAQVPVIVTKGPTEPVVESNV